MKIFIAGPYTRGDVAQNVRAAIDAAEKIIEAGYVPFVPHLSHFQHLIHPRPYEDWLRLDREWLKVCDAIVRLPGESPGAVGEIAFARELEIPVFTLDQVMHEI